MTTEAFTDSDEVVERDPVSGMPFPFDTEDSIGWLVKVDGVLGVVRKSSWSRVEVQPVGGCPRPCCWDSVSLKDVTYVALLTCDKCDSGRPAVLCLCDDDPDDILDLEVES